jgi:hypothetical protein
LDILLIATNFSAALDLHAKEADKWNVRMGWWKTRSQKLWCTKAAQARQKPKLTKLTNWTNKFTTVVWRICNNALQPFRTLSPVEVFSSPINRIVNISG